MLFDPSQTEFAHDFQRAAWQLGIQILPPEISLANVEDEETREGCMQIYNCAMEMLTDMYNHKEGQTENPIGYRVTYLLWLLNGVKSAPFKRDVDSYAYFLEKIPLYGFTYDENLNAWTNDRYPLFCEYFARFADLYKKRKQNMGDYTLRLDFRLFVKRINLTFDDLLRPLPDAERAYFSELREYAIAKGMKEEKVEDRFRYIYKKHRSLELRIYPPELPTLPAYIVVPFGQFERFLEIAENQPDADALVQYILDNLKFCDGCAANVTSRAKEKEKKKCGYYWVNIRDEKRLSCAGSSITTWQYSKPKKALSDEDIRMMKRMTDIRIAQIDSSTQN